MSNFKGQAVRARQKMKTETQRQITNVQSSDSVREIRHGYRRLGALQLTKLYGSEGVFVVDIGGPPRVGA